MYEIDFIKNIAGGFRRSPDQHNELFTSDCEVVTIGNTTFGFSVDDFSAEEDFLGPDSKGDLFKLGQNLAIASLSDILVSGCIPKFYMQSIVTPRDSPEFAVKISEGIRDILERCGTFLIGGDIGSDSHWRYTGIGIGTFDDVKPVSRILPSRPQSIWVTGSLGGINLNAYTATSGISTEVLPFNSLSLRLEESGAIRSHGLASIDTSGGFMDSVWTLSYLNPEFSFVIDPRKVPYERSVIGFCQDQGIPPEAFLVGGAGEYEFIFTTDQDIEIPNATKIGAAIPSDHSEIKWGDRIIGTPPPSPRGYKSMDEYKVEIQEYIMKMMS